MFLREQGWRSLKCFKCVFKQSYHTHTLSHRRCCTFAQQLTVKQNNITLKSISVEFLFTFAQNIVLKWIVYVKMLQIAIIIIRIRYFIGFGLHWNWLYTFHIFGKVIAPYLHDEIQIIWRLKVDASLTWQRINLNRWARFIDAWLVFANRVSWWSRYGCNFMNGWLKMR